VKLHPLSPDMKCQTCGGELEFVRVRRFADLYQCARGAKVCPGDVLHYCKAGTTTCGWARVLSSGFPGQVDRVRAPIGEGGVDPCTYTRSTRR
jgi:hypothetical protein